MTDATIECYAWATRTLRALYPMHIEKSHIGLLQETLDITSEKLNLVKKVDESKCLVRAVMVIKINHCKDLMAKAGSTSNPYVSVHFRSTIKVSKVFVGQTSPIFNLEIPIILDLNAKTFDVDTFHAVGSGSMPAGPSSSTIFDNLLKPFKITICIWNSKNPDTHGYHKTTETEVAPVSSKDRFLGQIELQPENLSKLIHSQTVIALGKRSSKSHISGSTELSVSCYPTNDENCYSQRQIFVQRLFHQSLKNPDIEKVLEVLGLVKLFAEPAGLSYVSLAKLVLRELINNKESMARTVFTAVVNDMLVDIVSDVDLENDMNKELKECLMEVVEKYESVLSHYNRTSSEPLQAETLRQILNVLLMNRRLHKIQVSDDCNYLATLIMQGCLSNGLLMDDWLKDDKFQEEINDSPHQQSAAWNIIRRVKEISYQTECLSVYLLNDLKYHAIIFEYTDLKIVEIDVQSICKRHANIIYNFIEQLDLTNETTKEAIFYHIDDFVHFYTVLSDLTNNTLVQVFRDFPDVDNWYDPYDHWFFSLSLVWMEYAQGQATVYIANSLKVDEGLNVIDEDNVKHSSSVIDMFSCLTPHVEFAKKLEFQNKSSFAMICLIMVDSVAHYLEEYAEWLKSRVFELDEKEMAVTNNNLHPGDSKPMKSFKISQRMCTAMNNIIESYDHVKDLFLPLGIEVDVNSITDLSCDAHTSMMRKSLQHSFLILNDALDDLSTSFTLEIKKVFGEQLKMIVQDSGAAIIRLRVKYDDTNGTSQKKFKRWVKRRMTSNSKDETGKNSLKEKKKKKDHSDSSDDTNNNMVDSLLAFIDELLLGLSIHLYDDTFFHMMRLLWVSLLESMILLLLPSYRTSKFKLVSEEKCGVLKQLIEGSYNLLFADGEGLSKAELECDQYVRVNTILSGLFDSNLKLMTKYVYSQKNRPLNMNVDRFILCTVKQSRLYHDNREYYEIGVKNVAIQNCALATYTVKVGMYNINGLTHDYKEINIEDENLDFRFSVPRSMLNHLLHFTVEIPVQKQGSEKVNVMFVGESMYDLSFLELDDDAVCTMSMTFLEDLVSLDALNMLNMRTNDQAAVDFASKRLKPYLETSVIATTNGIPKTPNVQEINGHAYKINYISSAKIHCKTCSKRIVGVHKSVYRCLKCDITVHKKCGPNSLACTASESTSSSQKP